MGQVLVTLVLKSNEYLNTPSKEQAEAMQQLPEPSRNFCEMPVEIVGMIIGRLDYRAQRALRRTCKTLRYQVDKQRPACTNLSISNSPDGVICEYDDYKVAYFSPRIGIEEFQARNPECHGFIQRENYNEVALNDFEHTLKNPRLRLEKLKVFYNCEQLMEILNPNYQVSVRELEIQMRTPACLLSILPLVQPRIFNTITIRGEEVQWSAIQLRQLARLEQWIHCEELQLFRAFDYTTRNSVRHFRRFTIHYDDMESAPFFATQMYFFELANFEQCTLFVRELPNRREEYQIMLRGPIDNNGQVETYNFLITTQDHYLETRYFAADPTRVDIVRRRRHPN